jgi:diacylglycerol kinase (CTP)
MAAIAVASLTAAVFWGTSIAAIGQRSEGLSIHDEFGRAVLGTSNAPGFLGNGWTGLQWGFRPSHPNIFNADTSRDVINSITESLKKVKDAATTPSTHNKSIPLPLLCVASGLVAGVAEGLELGGVDDNLSLPILTAVGIHSILVGWGWLASHFSW